MKLNERLKNLWRLSAYEAKQPSQPIEIGATPVLLVKKPELQKGRFIPRVVVTPAQEIVNENTHEN